MISIRPTAIAHISQLLATAMDDAETALHGSMDPLRDMALFRHRLHAINSYMMDAVKAAKNRPSDEANMYMTIEFLHEMQTKLAQAEAIEHQFTQLVETRPHTALLSALAT
ncbi:hypothetical protein SDRG_04585 [Saprolegnia diclina VS20]|uniref:Chemotaxis protein n=1 Tax=Saprolegnia diclina (strain VS20) TaxID=1156394 RepID=T0QTW7_SAPDV|nr:hypothetical protein SDRG_04585 [Saprolegnia diclina VS20]EQC38156.1 hypothetical protein SDRG_04585 [Saprolegnia diclina VS20]|eukprot:XP_008608483.1 hypothetical protein SDRG_04585 [Saprolegnia diclina VS20]